MLKVRSLVGVAAALILMALGAQPAWAVGCTSNTPISPALTSADVGTTFNVTFGGALNLTSCDVGPMTFSDMFLRATALSGDVTLQFASVTPFIGTGPLTGEFGVELDFSADAKSANSTIDFVWGYNVTGNPFISDAYLALTCTLTGSGSCGTTETFPSNPGIGPLQVTGSNSNLIFFDPVNGLLQARKDSFSQTGESNGSSNFSIMINAYSVPGPVVGAGLPGLVAACGGLIGLARRRRRQMA
jgi:hypothetical protein